MAVKNSDKAVKKTTNKIVSAADDSGTRCLDTKEYCKKKNPLDIEYVNGTSFEDFLKALEYDPIKSANNESIDTSNAEHISAWTDALPVISTSTPRSVKLMSKKSSKKKLIEKKAAKPNGISHSLLQYPLINYLSALCITDDICIYVTGDKRPDATASKLTQMSFGPSLGFGEARSGLINM